MFLADGASMLVVILACACGANFADELLAEVDGSRIGSDLSGAIERIEAALIASPDLASSAELHNRLGELRANNGDLDGAEEALRKALELRPTYARAMGTLANVLAQPAGFTMATEKEFEALRLGVKARQLLAAERGEPVPDVQLPKVKAPWLDPDEAAEFMRRAVEDAPAAELRRELLELQFWEEQAGKRTLSVKEQRRKQELDARAEARVVREASAKEPGACEGA